MFPTKILLATDGSAEAGRAARMAVTLSEKLGSELHVVYVEPLPEPYAAPEALTYRPDFRDELRRIAEREADERLDEEAMKVGSIGEVAGAHAWVGRPDAEIVRLAEELGAGLVVVGNRGRGSLKRTFLGSVSGSVVRHAHCPVLVARDGRDANRLPGRILVAIDGSKEAQAAKEAAVEISNATGSELHLLYAMQAEENPPYSHPLMGERWGATLDQAKHAARQFVDEQAELIEGEGGTVKDAHLVFGRADEEIVKLGEELEAGLVVLGSRGLGGVRRALMGSVSGSVVRHAHSPVLVVRSADRAKDAPIRPAEERART